MRCDQERRRVSQGAQDRQQDGDRWLRLRSYPARTVVVQDMLG